MRTLLKWSEFLRLRVYPQIFCVQQQFTFMDERNVVFLWKSFFANYQNSVFLRLFFCRWWILSKFSESIFGSKLNILYIYIYIYIHIYYIYIIYKYIYYIYIYIYIYLKWRLIILLFRNTYFYLTLSIYDYIFSLRKYRFLEYTFNYIC